MKYLLILCISVLTFGADEKPTIEKLPAEAKLPMATAQRDLAETQALVDQKQAYYQQVIQQQADFKPLIEARDKALAAVNAARAKILADYKCTAPTCNLDEKTLDLSKQPAPPAPQATPPQPKPAK